MISSDAGLCVEKFCQWLFENHFLFLFRIKQNSGAIYNRIIDWADFVIKKNPDGNYFQSFHLESNQIHSRRLWRLPGLQYSNYPGISEAFVIIKTNLQTNQSDKQYFITNRLPDEWSCSDILKRILLHWEIETGIFGVKDRTFLEDQVRYSNINGAMSHVSLLNFSWNCLSAPKFQHFWKNQSTACKIQFWNPELWIRKQEDYSL